MDPLEFYFMYVGHNSIEYPTNALYAQIILCVFAVCFLGPLMKAFVNISFDSQRIKERLNIGNAKLYVINIFLCLILSVLFNFLLIHIQIDACSSDKLLLNESTFISLAIVVISTTISFLAIPNDYDASSIILIPAYWLGLIAQIFLNMLRSCINCFKKS